MRRRRSLLRRSEDSAPLSVVSNLFDVAMVFAVALMVALVSRYNMTEMFSQEDFTMVKNPGKENMEIITKEGEKINRYTPSEDKSASPRNRGKRVGVAYQLENGDVIYVPEGETPGKEPPPPRRDPPPLPPQNNPSISN